MADSFRLYILLAAFIAYAAYIISDGFNIDLGELFKDEAAAKKRSKEIEEELIAKSPIVIHEFCGSMGDCYKVMDRAYRFQDGEMRVQRDIVPEKIQTASLSQAVLTFPKELTEANSNTANWGIDKNVMITPYVMIMLASGYMIEALTFEKKTNRILAFGLGGGTLQNYISQFPKANIDVTTIEIDPVMVEVAETYFANKATGSNRIIIADGIEYAKEIKAKGEIYDYVVLDACSNDKARVVICPIDGFREEETIANIAQLINPMGGLVVNIVAYENPEHKEEQIRSLFAKYFASCFLMRILPEQRMLICSHRSEWTLASQRKRFEHNLRNQQEKIGIQVTDPLLSFNPQ
ncbi:unnamed protein product, partial [Mesorhabditis belari]|uniref:Spermine synthase n=1 Tax=Mesorhabditis belari TaxID=2138241 RepID=A0AAF3J7K6_9BILA